MLLTASDQAGNLGVLEPEKPLPYMKSSGFSIVDTYEFIPSG